jgi:hypothetical protein
LNNDNLVSAVGERAPWKPWANDPESFERAILADLEQRMTHPVTVNMMRELGRVFHSALLDGSYPNTTIVVSFLIHTGSVDEARFPVWDEAHRADNEMLDPESIAELIWIWLIEPG